MKNTIQYDTGRIEDGVIFGVNSRIKAKKVLIKKDCTIGDNAEIYANHIVLEECVRIGPGVVIRGDNVHLSRSVNISQKTGILSHDMRIDENTRIDDNTTITAYEKLKIGKNCIIRRNARFKARSISIGDFFYSNDYPTPLIIGGGGSERPTARVRIGSRCVMHDSFINVAMPVEIGDNVGFSPGSAIITHGFWNSVIEGYSSEFAPVAIGRNVIIGYRAIILPGVTIGDYCSIGAGAVVTRSFPPHCVIAGVPAKIIKTEPDYPKKLTHEDENKIVESLLKEYAGLLKEKVENVVFTRKANASIITGEYLSKKFQIVFLPHGREESWNKNLRTVLLAFRKVRIASGDFSINLSNCTWSGVDDAVSDDLRDFLRHYGIRIFSRHFNSIPPKLKRELTED
jgi:acetyltransferase-like isoleucine patch superfamily enzyme